MFVSIVVPAYKKEKTIKDDVKNIVVTMGQILHDYEIIVVVDGILDKTHSILDKYIKSPEFKKIVTPNLVHIDAYAYEQNIGKGFAIRLGMQKSSGDPVIFIDSGLKINTSGIAMLLEHMAWYDADVVVGSKRHPVSKVEYSTLRRIYSFFYQMLVFVLFRLRVKDTQVGLKAFRREVIEKVIPRLVIKEYAFDIEFLAIANYLGFKKIYEAPVEINFKVGSSRFTAGVLFDSFVRKMLWDTIAVFYRMYILRYYNSSNSKLWMKDPEMKSVKVYKRSFRK